MSNPVRLPVTRYTAASPPTGELFELARSARTADDGCFRFVWTLAAGKTGPAQHFHEDETEVFELVSGALRIWVNEVPHDLHPGDRLEIPAGVPHRFLANGAQAAVVNVSLSGPRMEDMLAPVAVASHGRAPTTGELLRMLMSIRAYRPSVPVGAFERAALGALTAALSWLGVRPFERVFGWDVEA